MRNSPRLPYILAALLGPLLLLWPPAPLALCFDDAYYYFQIARHLAAGEGSTFDGINATNGYHPLWMLVCTLAFALRGDPDTTVRLLLALQFLLWMAALSFLHPPESSQRLPIPLIAGLAVVQTAVNGLESGMVALTHAALLSALLSGRSWKWLLPLAFLARTDGAFLAGTLFLETLKGDRRLSRLLPFLVVFLSYLLVNHHFFGSALQVSGSIKRLPLSAGRTVAFLLLVLVPALSLPTHPRTAAFPRSHDFLLRTRAYGIFVAAILGYYGFLQAFPQLWYFLPAVLYGIGLLANLVEDLAERAVGEGSSPRTLRAIFLIPLVAVALYQGVRLADPRGRTAAEADRDLAWRTEQLPEEAVIGAWDAGVIGFYAPRRVINLDGLVNSPAYLQAMRAGTAGALLQSQGLGYILNHDEIAEGKATVLPQIAASLLGPVSLEELDRIEYQYFGASNRSSRGVHTMASLLLRIRWPTAPPPRPPPVPSGS